MYTRTLQYLRIFVYIQIKHTHRVYIYIALSPLEELPNSPRSLLPLCTCQVRQHHWFKLGVGGGGLITFMTCCRTTLRRTNLYVGCRTVTFRVRFTLAECQTEHQTLPNSDMQIPAFSIFCELWIHGSRIALLCLESCRPFSSWHSRFFNPALDEFWRCSGETLDAAPPPLTHDESRNIAAEHIKDKFILHVDGATADNVKPDGVEIRKASVDHRCRNGEPYFVKEQFTSISVISVGATKEKPS